MSDGTQNLLLAMKSIIIYLVIFLFAWSSCAQQVFNIEIEPLQQSKAFNGDIGSEITVPNRLATVVLGGTFNKEGLGRYIVMDGAILMVDMLDIRPDGYYYVSLRREDGRDFFNLTPTLNAKLTPINKIKEEVR